MQWEQSDLRRQQIDTIHNFNKESAKSYPQLAIQVNIIIKLEAKYKPKSQEKRQPKKKILSMSSNIDILRSITQVHSITMVFATITKAYLDRAAGSDQQN